MPLSSMARRRCRPWMILLPIAYFSVFVFAAAELLSGTSRVSSNALRYLSERLRWGLAYVLINRKAFPSHCK